MTDVLQAIAENAAIPAAAFTDGQAGKVMTRRWMGEDKPAPLEETRTPEEIIEHIRASIASL